MSQEQGQSHGGEEFARDLPAWQSPAHVVTSACPPVINARFSPGTGPSPSLPRQNARRFSASMTLLSIGCDRCDLWAAEMGRWGEGGPRKGGEGVLVGCSGPEFSNIRLLPHIFDGKKCLPVALVVVGVRQAQANEALES